MPDKPLKTRAKRTNPPQPERRTDRIPVFKGTTIGAAQDFIRKHSDAIEMKVRMARGLPYRATGPTGKIHWRETPEELQVAAINDCFDRLVPRLKSVEVSGDPDNPVMIGRADMDMRELARRLGFILSSNSAGQLSASLTGLPPGDTATEANPCAGADPGAFYDWDAPPAGDGEVVPASPSPETFEVGHAEDFGPFTVRLEEIAEDGAERWIVEHDGEVIHRTGVRQAAFAFAEASAKEAAE